MYPLRYKYQKKDRFFEAKGDKENAKQQPMAESMANVPYTIFQFCVENLDLSLS